MLREKLKLAEEKNIYREISRWKKENEDSGLYVWGTGSVAAGVTNALLEHGIGIDGYFTDVEGAAVDPRIAANGIGKFTLAELRDGGKMISVVVGHSHYELADSLAEEGFVGRIWLLPGVTRPNLHLSGEFILEHMRELEKVYEKLEDEKSRLNMVDYLNANITMDVEDILSHFDSSSNYFSEGTMQLSEEESYLDLGAYDGTSVEDFIREVKGRFKDITVVEVMPDMVRQLKQKAWADEENVQILHVGISDHVGTDCFDMNSQSTCLSENGEEVQVTTVDSLPCQNISLIKICIGDSVKPILRGGRETIRRQQPKMVISAGIDRYALIEYIPLIEEIAGEGAYRFYLRFTSATTECLALYALPRSPHACERVAEEQGEEPMFSIMMTVYNDTSLLSAAISSCLRQNFSSWELLILDNSDKSDEPWRMIQNAVACDGRIHGFRSEKSVGWAKGSQVLLGHARGEYVTFLSADDCLVPGALLRVDEEIRKNHPDVVFVGNIYVNYLGDGEMEYLNEVLPEYRVYAGGSRSEALVEIMQNVYYNSMFHYEKRSFMQENGMDFYEPYYGDCSTMTYAITKAERIVVLDMVAYCLTMNTSQSTGNYGVFSEEYIFMSQWRSARALFMQEQFSDRTKIYYVAERIFRNYVASIGTLCIGRWRDKFMNPIEPVDIDDIIGELMRNLSSADVGELFFLMGSPGFDALLSNVANIKKFSEEEIRAAAEDCWVDPLIRLALGRRKFSFQEKLDIICDFLLMKENPWCIGIYTFQQMAERCGDEELNQFRDKLGKVLVKYDGLMNRISGTWLMNMIE